MNIKEYVDDKTIKLDIVTVKFELIRSLRRSFCVLFQENVICYV